MKKCLCMLLLVAINNCMVAKVTAQVVPLAPKSATVSPPLAVAKTFIAVFGNVPVRQWKLKSDGKWYAHFSRSNRAWRATFSIKGMLLKSEPA